MSKRITNKQIETSGWGNFLRWAVANGIRPEKLGQDVVVKWHAHLATLGLLHKIETSMFVSTSKGKGLKQLAKLVGLSKQVGRSQ